MNFKNKVVWITGASSGIGKELAIALKSQGAKLILSSRKREKLYQLKQALKTDPINTHILSLDLTDKQTLALKSEEAWRIYGYIDILIHCGGISQRSLGLETSLEVEQQILDTNYWGTVILSKNIIPRMIENGSGHVVIISSLMGKFGTQYRTSYAASKHALHGYFDSLRCEVYDKGIDISIICPGFVNTDITKNSLTANGEKYERSDDFQLNGISPKECALQILKAIEKKKEEVIIAGKEKWGVILKRFFPAYFSKMIRKRKVI
ncbi:SDR family oxidoreductase [Pseudopedobacter sp.]|uniref:SDR family oxidoreductase n=1 Tax=Pseudopedobacter sp. TaxID=1936787 RepID=UPI00334271D9